MDFVIINALVCDDVRREITNKDILIGVYSDGINIPSLPASVNICFWMKVIPKKLGRLSIELKVDLPGNPTPIQVKVEADVLAINRPFSLYTPQILYPIMKDGDIKLSARQSGLKTWNAVEKIRVEYLPPSFSAPTS
jgi:hypothetical protein